MLLATAIGVVARATIDPWVGDGFPYLTMFPAVALAGYFGNLTAGIVTALVGGTLANALFITPRGELSFPGTAELIGFAGYMVGSAAICLLIRSRTQAWREAKSAETALKASQERLHLAHRAAEMGAWEWNIGTGAVVWSDEVCLLHGIQPGAFDGEFQSWLETVHPDDREKAQAAVREALERRGTYATEYRTVLPDGAVRWTAARGQIFRDGEGRPERLVGVCMDVTEQRNAAAALRASEERLEVAQQAARMGSWEWDVESGAIVWSQGVPALHGLGPDGFDGSVESWWKLVLPEDRQRVREAIGEALAGRREYELEFRTPWPDGSVHWIAARGRVFRDAAGRPLRMVGIGMDVTERKQAEEQLRHAEKMAATGRMAATLAHEINNPLAALTNLGYILQSHPELPGELRQHAEMLDQELRRVGRIVQQTLGLYRQDVPSSAPVALSEVIDDVLAVYQEKLRGFTVEKRCDPACTVLAHRVELHQLLTNLLLNAVEASANGRGAIAIRVRRAHDWRSGRNGVRIVVADAGTGMDAESRRRISEPFFTTKHQKGTGLGLSVVQWVAAKHEGWLRVRSSNRPGRSGTCVWVFLGGGEGKNASRPEPAVRSLAS